MSARRWPRWPVWWNGLEGSSAEAGGSVGGGPDWLADEVTGERQGGGGIDVRLDDEYAVHPDLGGGQTGPGPAGSQRLFWRNGRHPTPSAGALSVIGNWALVVASALGLPPLRVADGVLEPIRKMPDRIGIQLGCQVTRSGPVVFGRSGSEDIEGLPSRPDPDRLSSKTP